MQPSERVRPLSRRAIISIWVLLAFVALLVIGPRLIAVYTEWLWFGEVGYRTVWGTILVTRLILFAAVTLVIGALMFGAVVWAYRARPLVAAAATDPIGQYRTVVMSRPRLFGLGIPLLLALPFGLSAQANWATVQLFLRGGGFGSVDAEFGHDIGFYVFDLPLYRMALTWLFVAVFLAFLLSLGAHYLFGGIRLSPKKGSTIEVTGAARVQLAVLAGTFIALKAVAYWLDRYALLWGSRKEPTFTGAGFTDINAVLPARLIMFSIAIVCAVAFFAAIWVRDLRIPAMAAALLVLSSILVGGIWPALMEQFSVRPNAADRESPYIERNIAATRQAYGIGPDRVQYQDYPGVGTRPPREVPADVTTIANARLLDPNVLSRTFTQQQQLKNFYGFTHTLDIDRYTIDGELADYIVAARELSPNSLSGNQTQWINQHLVYTHGNGFVAAPANRVNAAVRDASGQSSSSDSGYPHRDPATRVEHVAPWLTTDTNPYPAVVDGRITWIVDAYTTLEHYPYSQAGTLAEPVVTDTGRTVPREEISYVRNSVKATVDAYDGTVTLYQVDRDDPVLAAWMSVFPGTVRPDEAISDDLRAHFRYPEGLFRMQRERLAKYHVNDPREFFTNNAFWSVPSDPTSDSTGQQPPYYVLVGDPQTAAPSFRLASAMVGFNREFLSAYLSVRSDPDGYGTIEVLQLPTDTLTQGPQQIQNSMISDTRVASERTLLERSNRIHFGNLLTLPIADGGVLYVEPLYTERLSTTADGSTFPQLARVLVSYREPGTGGVRVGYAPTLAEALDQVFGAGTGRAATAPGGDAATAPPPATEGTPPPAEQGAPPAPPSATPEELTAAVLELNDALANLREAQHTGDFTSYGTALDRLQRAIDGYLAAGGSLN